MGVDVHVFVSSTPYVNVRYLCQDIYSVYSEGEALGRESSARTRIETGVVLQEYSAITSLSPHIY